MPRLDLQSSLPPSRARAAAVGGRPPRTRWGQGASSRPHPRLLTPGPASAGSAHQGARGTAVFTTEKQLRGSGSNPRDSRSQSHRGDDSHNLGKAGSSAPGARTGAAGRPPAQPTSKAGAILTIFLWASWSGPHRQSETTRWGTARRGSRRSVPPARCPPAPQPTL